VTGPEATQPCRNCGRQRPPGQLDGAGWCDVCRAEVVRRANLPARVAGILFAVLLVVLFVWLGALESRFVVMWLAATVFVAWGAFKVARRAAFEVIRARGVTPPAEAEAEAP
jgi:hypothetical protein